MVQRSINSLNSSISSVSKNEFIIVRIQTNRQLQPTSFLPAASQMPFLLRSCPSQRKQQEKRCRFLLKLSLAPGYSKLQIAADNIARYWNMFDLLTHTAPPPPPLLLHLLLVLLLQNSGRHGASTLTKLWKATGGEPHGRMFNRRKK